MKSKTLLITGTMLVDAPLSALNNAGTDRGQVTENMMKVKAFRKGRDWFPYVSGQAVKRWWRDTLLANTGWKPSPIFRQVEGAKQQAYTEANPLEYEEDDLFGYMKAVKPFTFRRVAPVKVSPLVSVEPAPPHIDFGVFARGEGDPVIYEQQLYSSILRGSFSVLANFVGRFGIGEMLDIPGRELEPKVKEKKEEKKKEEQTKALAFIEYRNRIWAKADEAGLKEDNGVLMLPNEERATRVYETILALATLTGGAKITSYLTDVAPKAIVAAPLTVANHIFLYTLKTMNYKPVLDTEALKDVLDDYKDYLANGKIYIGVREGFMSKEAYTEAENFSYEGVVVVFGTPKQVLETLAKDVKTLMTK